ncbi:hypothetical protein Patl1_28975 [Pistacia atlantica]|uniref:Uncharacterized protein n=1 Tax=Pistacia atlantica TaxID=434234 RepID=A0ACC1BDQ6_9ROSI|nr:hypothetical protein Patl1_28975 [Pistacia atlantica]
MIGSSQPATLHFVHSSYSVHWLSKVPENLENNKGNIYMAKSSPPSVHKAYLEQFQKDFSLFLSLRSEEIICGGRMLLTFIGRSVADPWSKDCCYLWELLTKSILELVDEGLVEESELVHSICHFIHHMQRKLREIVENQGSFNLEKIKVFEDELGSQ